MENNNIPRSIKKYLAVFYGLILFIFSCDSSSKDIDCKKNQNNRYVTIYKYQILSSNFENVKLIDSTRTYIDTINLDNRKNLIFSINDSTSIYHPYSIEKDSLFINNLFCPNFDTLFIQHKNEKIELIISIYNVEKLIDEELLIYWNHKYGIVAFYNYPWGVLFICERSDLPGFANKTSLNSFCQYNSTL